MARFRTFTEIVIDMIENLRLVQPNLDTKPGTVSRDLFIDAPADQLAQLYNELQTIQSLQSFLSTTGPDLERLASNFGVTKNQGTPATGTVIFTTSNLDVDILIPQGTVVVARNGVSFKTTTTVTMRSTNSNVFRATADRFRTQLSLASITDDYAVEVSVEALTSGTSGNVGAYSVISQNVSGISNVTNLSSFSGGTNVESDTSFRTRALSIFAGSNTGTTLGYETTIEADPNVQDVITIEPGDPLMTRDGTQVVTDTNGNLVVSEEGSGGKVDIYVLGTNTSSNIDSFIYNDQSGNNDPTNTLNDVILGQQGLALSLLRNDKLFTLNTHAQNQAARS